jgi:hypothetical protein
MIAQARRWLVVIFAVLMATGCGTDSNNALKPPSVYRGPQVRVTHEPTEMAVDPSTMEASASATVNPVAIQPLAGPTVDDEQFLMDDIEDLLDKIERKLDQTDVNP